MVRLAGDAVEKCRRRVQQQVHGHRGRKQNPLYKARRTLLTGADLLTDKQYSRIQDVFDADEHMEVEATWAFYKHMVAAYRESDRAKGKQMMQTLITKLGRAVPTKLTELAALGRTLKKRTADILACFDRPGTSNGPHRGHQRPAETPPRVRPRVQEPHQLHRPIAPGVRRIQAPATP